MRGDQFFARVAKRPPFTRLHPEIASFFKGYLGGEKVVPFGDFFVVNTQFPPYPGPAFDRLAQNFGFIGESGTDRLYSVTLAVTNRCRFQCWHCYNAGRSQQDLPLETLRKTAAVLQDLGAVMVTLTGGEPLLRDDLEEIAGGFNANSCLLVGTTGEGLTLERARRLASAGVFGTGISLDSDNREEHDALRGRKGAFRIALSALANARSAGLYPYVVTVASRELLRRERFFSFLRFARDQGALEVHLLEPCLTGRLAGRKDAALGAAGRRDILAYQRMAAADETLPILSSFAYLEGPDAFSCGAGLTHLYIDGTGEVSPCNLVPLSFGNIADLRLEDILARMRRHFRRPRLSCVGRVLAPHIPAGQLPAPPDVSEDICSHYLPRRHGMPEFFKVRSAAGAEVGREELKSAYDGVHAYYDGFWLTEAAGPIDELAGRIPWRGGECVFEAGCGTGYATALLARRAGTVLGADISPRMLEEAQRRFQREGIGNVRLIEADAIETMTAESPFDVVFSSWVLGYIALAPFFAAAARSLRPGGLLAVVVHREHSPRKPLEIFAELVARNPAVLKKRVAFDFPAGADTLRRQLEAAGFVTVDVREGAVTFRYRNAQEVLDHLLKSGAGTAYFEAIDAGRREELTDEFLQRIASENAGRRAIKVVHDYVACLARKTRRRKTLETKAGKAG